MKIHAKILLYCAIAVAASCKNEYPLPNEVRNLNLLVVEGLLNSGTGPTTIRLSRTFNPSDTGRFMPELRAEVVVEGENNTRTTLVGNNNGEYSVPQLNLNNSVRYRLRIKTSNGKEYLSDFVPIQLSPAIDSVHWQRTNDGIQFLVSTHDPQNKTQYYRWEYDETWEIHSTYISNFEWVVDRVVLRPDPFSIYFCWRSGSSNAIFLGSSAKLTQDVISAQQLHTVPLAAERISVRYSINVRQYPLTEQAYQFWNIMKKNTEQVGSLFDPQPSQLLSNIHPVSDPTEQVIGFVSAGTYSEKRLFVTRSQVEPWRYFVDCPERMIPLDSIKFFFQDKIYIPLQEAYAPMGGGLIGYHSSRRFCVDCTSRGTNVRPSFW